VEQPAAGEARYRMLETVRQYGQERLIEAGQQEVARGQHFDFYLRLVEEVDHRFLGGEQRSLLERLEREHDNLRAALAFDLAARLEGRLRLAGSLCWYWQSKGAVSEGLAYLERLLTVAGKAGASPGETASRAKALWAIGSLLWYKGDPATGQAHLAESVRLWRQVGAAGQRGLAEALRELGIVATYAADLTTASAALEESIQLWRDMGATWELGLALYNRGLVYETRDELTAAGGDYEESLALFRALNEGSGMALAHFGLAHLAGRQGNHAAALALLEECLALHRAERDAWGMAESLCLLGEVWQCSGDHERAVQCYAECLALNDDASDAGIFELALHNLGVIAQAGGRLRRAARLFGAARSLRPSARTAIPWSLGDPAGREQDVAIVRTALGGDAFTAAWAAGQAMALEEAIAYALAVSGDG
jgi:non-specific serine/threonine protein kinase